jgi:hypothetical protein
MSYIDDAKMLYCTTCGADNGAECFVLDYIKGTSYPRPATDANWVHTARVYGLRARRGFISGPQTVVSF